MNSSESTTQTNTEFARKMRHWAIWVLVLGLIGTMGLPQVVADLGVQNQELWALLRFIGRVVSLFGLPLSATLFTGAMIVRRLPEKTS